MGFYNFLVSFLFFKTIGSFSISLLFELIGSSSSGINSFEYILEGFSEPLDKISGGF